MPSGCLAVQIVEPACHAEPTCMQALQHHTMRAAQSSLLNQTTCAQAPLKPVSTEVQMPASQARKNGKKSMLHSFDMLTTPHVVANSNGFHANGRSNGNANGASNGSSNGSSNGHGYANGYMNGNDAYTGAAAAAVLVIPPDAVSG